MAERRPLTAEEKLWAENLSKIWHAKKKGLGLTQQKAAEIAGWSSQGSVTQYINGKIPLNTDAKIAFAKMLEVPVSDIDDQMSLAGIAEKAGVLKPPSNTILMGTLKGLPAKQKMAIIEAFAEQMSRDDAIRAISILAARAQADS